MISCAALAALMATAAIPAPGTAQIDRVIRKAAKEKVTQAAVDKAARAVGVQPDVAGAEAAAAATEDGAGASVRPGPRFTENLLEMTPDVLDRLERGLAAEQAVRQDIDRLTGKVLSSEEYRACRDSVEISPAGREVLVQAGDLLNGDTSQENLEKASRELTRRLEQLIEPKCGMNPMKAAEVRRQHADRLEAAAPDASGLTRLQLYLMKERVVPLCTALDALDALTMGAGEARVSTTAESVFWVYTAVEVESLRPRCGGLMATLQAGA